MAPAQPVGDHVIQRAPGQVPTLGGMMEMFKGLSGGMEMIIEPAVKAPLPYMSGAPIPRFANGRPRPMGRTRGRGKSAGGYGRARG